MMKKITYFLLFTLASIHLSAQVFWTEDFETDGETVRYTSSSVFNDGTNDHYGRTNGSNISGGYVSPNGSWFMAGEDLDDNGGDGSAQKTTEFASQNITGMTDIRFSGLFAQGTSGAGGLDGSDYLELSYRIDGGAWVLFMRFTGVSSGSNVGWAEDTNLDGTGDGVALSNTFASYLEDISVSGSTFEIRVVASANSASEEFAYDFFQLDDISGAGPIPTLSASAAALSGFSYVFGSGPSAIDTLEFSGSSLTGNVTSLGGLADFEFSSDGIIWGDGSGSSVDFTSLNAGNNEPVYFRLKAGLAEGSYSESITFSSAGAIDVTISLSGDVTAAPCVQTVQNLPYNGISGTAGFDHNSANPPAVAPAESCGANFILTYTSTPVTDASGNEFGNQSNLGLTGLSSADFGGPASFNTFPVDVSGVNAVNITAIGNTAGSGVFNGSAGSPSVTEEFTWWYSLDGGPQIAFFNTTADGSLAASVSSLDVSGVNQIVVGFDFAVNGAGDGFEGVDVSIVEALPNPPTITAGSTSMSGFTYLEGSGPSDTLNNTIEWTDLTTNVSSDNTVNYFEFSTDNGLNWGDASLLNVSIPPLPVSSVSPINVSVRLVSGLTAGTYLDTLVLSSAGATTVNVFLSGVVTPQPIAVCTELFFSEYIEGSSSNKCLEIYNPTASDIDLGAGNYAIGIYGNGSTTPNGGATVPLTGVIPAYGTFVICNNGATAAFTALADVVGGSFNAVTFYNGNDAVSLEKNGVFVDVIGQIGNDPGSAWTGSGISTANQTLVRMASVQAGDNIDSDAFDPSTEWMALPQNDASNLGWHNNTCAPFVWTGLTSTDYHTGSNWTKGTVPTDTDHAWIPSSPVGGVFPLASQDVDLMDLTVRSSASLDMAPTFGLTFDETANVDGTLTLQSGASGTAWMDDFTSPTATYNGNITVQTYVSTGSGLGQRYFGSPVIAGTVSGLDNTYATGYPLGPVVPLPTCDPDSLAVGSPYSNLFLWNEDDPFTLSCVQEGWEAIAASTVLTPGRGYSGWMNDGSIISITGAPNTGDVSFSTTGTTGAVAGASGWHVLSNPFTSPLDVTSVNTSSSFSSVQIYNGASGPFSGTFLPVQLTGPLAVMQGFVAEHAGGSPVFNALEASRSTGNEVWQRPDFGHMLNLTLLGNGVGDQTFVYFKHDATDNFDNAGDCKKRQSDAGYPTLFTMNNGERMSLNGLSSDNMNRSIDLGLMPGITGNFTLSFDGLNSFPATTLIFLEDKLTGEMFSVREVNEYTFDADVNDSEDRFVLHFTSPVELVATEASCEGSDATITMDFGQNLIAGNSIKWNYSVMSSSNIINAAIDQNGVVVIDNLDKGNYSIELQHGNFITSIDLLVEGAERVVADFENPVAVEEGTWVNLANLSTGAVNYEWTVEGQQYSTQDLNHQFITPGQHEISLASSNGDCEEVKTKFIEVFAKSTGITDAHELANANVYTNDNIIVIDLNGVENIDDYTAFIFNLLGQEVDVVEISSAITQVEINDGGKYYFVQLVQGKTQKVFKVLVK
jgi:hypothetical protein